METLETVTINETQVDWYTLTSSSGFWHKAISSIMEEDVYIYGDRVRDGRVENYRGDLYKSGAFCGKGTQAGKIHYLARCTGETAHRSFTNLVSRHDESGERAIIARCTRIDVQVTHQIYESWEAREVSAIWQENGLNARLVEGGGGMDTIYIGSRKSNYFWRVYVKEDVDKNKLLRWELQLNKGDGHSVQAWSALCAGESIGSIMSAYAADEDYLLTGVRSYDLQVKDFLRCLQGGYMKPKRIVTSSFYKWLKSQVYPALINRENDHTLKPMIKDWLESTVRAFGGEVEWYNDDEV